MSTLNRMGNAQNPFQGDGKKVLCVCSAGLLRSPTAAVVLASTYGFNTRAAGINSEYALIPVDEVLMYWADEIVVMEEWMEKRVRLINPKLEINVKVLNVPDNFRYMDEKLQKLIIRAYENTDNGG